MSSRNIVVIGISGTGKSTISRKLAALKGLPLYHMDSIIWRENWMESDDHTIQLLLEDIADIDGWIVEGWVDELFLKIKPEQFELAVQGFCWRRRK